jgi:hypothetical protein
MLEKARLEHISIKYIIHLFKKIQFNNCVKFKKIFQKLNNKIRKLKHFEKKKR